MTGYQAWPKILEAELGSKLKKLPIETVGEDGTKRIYNYINNIPLNASNSDLLINFLEY